MVTSRKYITMNIRRPSSSLIENNIDSVSQNNTKTSGHNNTQNNTDYTQAAQAQTQKKLLAMHTNSSPASNQKTTYLPLKRSLNLSKKPVLMNNCPNTMVNNTISGRESQTTSLNSSLTTHSSSSKSDLSQSKSKSNNEHNNHFSKTSEIMVKDYNKEDTEDLKTNRYPISDNNNKKNRIELINIIPSTTKNTLINPNMNNETTSRLRQSFFMNEFHPVNKSANFNSSATSKNNSPNNIKNNENLNLSNIANINATFERYEQMPESQEKQNTKSQGFMNTTQNTDTSDYNNNNSPKYSTNNTNSALPSKHTVNTISTTTTNRSNSLLQKSKLGIKSAEKVMPETPKPTKISHLNKSHSETPTEKIRSSGTLSSSGNVNSVRNVPIKGPTYKNFVLANKIKTKSMNTNNNNINESSTNGGTSGSNQFCNQMQTSNQVGSAKYMLQGYGKSKPKAQQTSKSVNIEADSDREYIHYYENHENQNSNLIVDQMASFIDELKDFIDDRLIDTTSQLEMANQRISGLYYNLNYLTKEFMDLKNQNEELKFELLQNNNNQNNNNLSYYQKMNQSRQRNKNRSASFNTKKINTDTKNSTLSENQNSSSKTSSIETASSSTSESLTMSHTALTPNSVHESVQKSRDGLDYPSLLKSDDKMEQNHQEETIRHLSRNEMILILKNQELNDLKYNNKLTSSSSSVNSVNFYENNISINENNKNIDINWSDNNNCIEQNNNNQYILRTSSQIELNNIAEGKYASIEEFEQNDMENYDVNNNNTRIPISNSSYENDMRSTKMNRPTVVVADTNVTSLDYENKFMKLKEADKKNSLTYDKVNSKLVHHALHAPIIPYSNFRDFDTQYSWDYTDNLVNKFTAKLGQNNTNNIKT